MLPLLLLLTMSGWLPAQLPPIEDLIRGLEDAEKSIANFSVTSHIEALSRPREGAVGAERTDSLVATYTVDSADRSRYRVSSATPAPDGGREETIETFDGEEFRAVMTADQASRGKLSATADDRTWQVNPWDYTTKFHGLSVREMIRTQGVESYSEDRWENRLVLKVVCKPAKPAGTMKNEFWIDPSRGFAVVRKRSYLLWKEKWTIYSDIQGSDYDEAAPSIWVPRKFLYESFRPVADGVALRFRNAIRNENWEVNEPAIPPDTFKVEFPSQTFVIDAKLGTSYTTGVITDQALADSAAETRTARSRGGAFSSSWPWVAIGLGGGFVVASLAVIAWRVLNKRRRVGQP